MYVCEGVLARHVHRVARMPGARESLRTREIVAKLLRQRCARIGRTPQRQRYTGTDTTKTTHTNKNTVLNEVVNDIGGGFRRLCLCLWRRHLWRTIRVSN